jgi:hypothetical protein
MGRAFGRLLGTDLIIYGVIRDYFHPSRGGSGASTALASRGLIMSRCGGTGNDEDLCDVLFKPRGERIGVGYVEPDAEVPASVVLQSAVNAGSALDNDARFEGTQHARVLRRKLARNMAEKLPGARKDLDSVSVDWIRWLASEAEHDLTLTAIVGELLRAVHVYETADRVLPI